MGNKSNNLGSSAQTIDSKEKMLSHLPTEVKQNYDYCDCISSISLVLTILSLHPAAQRLFRPLYHPVSR